MSVLKEKNEKLKKIYHNPTPFLFYKMYKENKKNECKAFTVSEKMMILSYFDFVEEKKPMKEIADDLKIAKSTLMGIIENRMIIEKNYRDNSWNLKRYRFRQSEHPLIDRCLFIWMNNIFENPSSGIVINASSIKYTAEKFQVLLGDGKKDISDSYIQRWRERNNIKSYPIVGQSSGADTQSFNNWKTRIFQQILGMFEEKNIFNLDETGILFLYTLFYHIIVFFFFFMYFIF